MAEDDVYAPGWDAVWRSLPTEPHISVRVAWRDPTMVAARLFTLSGGGTWFSADGVAFEPLPIRSFTIVGKPVEPVESEPDSERAASRNLQPLGDGFYRYTGLRRSARTGQWLVPDPTPQDPEAVI